MSSIEVRGAVKSYDNKKFILNGLNLTVKTGSIYGLIGASGCGKTTLLSCILGMKQLEKGSIKVFGEEVSFQRPSKFSHLIGYMPQELALIPELTIKETIRYFGNIFQMNPELLEKRLRMICELLDLRNENKRIEQLSGGEKRRVSLAAVIIHDPRILILDEPTVGLDSILRDKIWTFLIATTKTSHMSVIITTHYIAEAEKSDCCGLMRHGVLLAEESPRQIISRFDVSSLDEAFLNLCLTQTNNPKFIIDGGENSKKMLEIESCRTEYPMLDENKNIKFDKREKFSKQTISALFKKELIRVKRQPAEILFIFIFPICQIVCFALAVGMNPIGLQLGIVNYENHDDKFCSEYLRATNFSFNSSSCYFENLSCYFLDEIYDTTAHKIYYSSFDDAFRDAKATKTIGFITIASNFTSAMTERKIDWDPMAENVSDANIIQIYTDQGNLVVSSFVRHKLIQAYQRFNKKVLRQCSLDERLEEVPLRMDNGLFYGSFDGDYVITLMPGFFAQVVLLGGIIFSSSTIAQGRIEGVWNRTLLAGVKTSEILFVYIIVFLITDIIQIGVLRITMYFLYDSVIVGSQWHIGIFCLAICIVGSSIGLLLSILTNSMAVVSCAGLIVFFVCGCLCGALWPVEAQHPLIRYFSYSLPTTIPSLSMRNILAKGYDFSHPTVYGGFGVLCGWLIIILTMCFITLRKRKFTEDSR